MVSQLVIGLMLYSGYFVELFSRENEGSATPYKNQSILDKEDNSEYNYCYYLFY